MSIKSKKIDLKNFKAIKEFACEFGNEITTISGENGTGKSTIVDAFMWVLFGKDSHGRSDFEIQTLDSNNNVIHGLEHSVTLALDADGKERTFKRTLKERWVKPNGKAEKELKGCTTDFKVDEIPVKQKEYQAAINEMIDENLFKMVTNPLYFSTLKWDKQREILLDIIGDISEENVINYNPKLKQLSTLLTDGIENFNKRIKASISKLKDQVKSIPARIDECNNNIKDIDIEALGFRKRDIQGSINSLDEQIADSSKANEEKLKLQDELFTLKDKLTTLTNVALKNANKPLNELQKKINNVKAEIQETRFKILTAENERDRKSDYIQSVKEDIENTKTRKQNLLNDYHKEKDIPFEFNDSLTSCPTCGREYEIEKIEEIKIDAENKFNAAKKKTLDYVISKGKPLANDIEVMELKIKDTTSTIETLTNKIVELEGKKFVLDQNFEELEYQKQKINCVEPVIEGEKDLVSQIEAIRDQISNFKSNDNTELKNQKKALQDELEEVNITLGKKDVNEDLRKRMAELNQEEKDLQIKIAELEGQQFLGEEFIRTKVELLEDSINKKFKGVVTFKLFENQVNGGLSETCEALINGVPFGDANTASRINAGLSILNTLCEHYGVSAPVFIDNAESVNQIGNTESQLIKLIVSLDKKMKVEVDK